MILLIKRLLSPCTILFFLSAAIFFGSSSCTSYKNIAYFEDLPDTAKPQIAKTFPFKSPVIQTGDLLTITIQTIDNDVTNLLNSNSSNVNGGNSSTPVMGSSSGVSQQVPNGYLVDSGGNVELPFAGIIHLAGMTTSQAKDAVHLQVSKYFNNPVINVRFANFRITVLGEVEHPSTFIIPNEKVNIFDALGMAGDLTIFGKRGNLVLLRDTLDAKKMIRLNLNSKDIVSSPWFYLQPNDVIYVEPSKFKVESVDAVRNRNITIISSVLSVTLILFTRVIRN